jgi:hypothetical protein
MSLVSHTSQTDLCYHFDQPLLDSKLLLCGCAAPSLLFEQPVRIISKTDEVMKQTAV